MKIGFEPILLHKVYYLYDFTKVLCLTTWLYPYLCAFVYRYVSGALTPGTSFRTVNTFFISYALSESGALGMSHIERLLARAVLEFSSIREAISTPQNRRMHALRRVWMRESVTIRRGSAYETELETFPSRNISGSFKSYLGFYTRGKWSTTSDSNGNLNGFEPFLSASWSSGRCKPQKEGESSHTSHMLFRGFVFFLPHISLRLQNTKGQLSLVALVEFESTLNGFSYYSMLPWPHFCVVVWTLSLPYHTT